MPKLEKPKTLKVSTIKKKAWGFFSKYRRLLFADENGLVKCITCEWWGPWEHAQGGHFIPGRGNVVLYDEFQVWPQCYRCNVILKGNWVAYLKHMEKKFGENVVHSMLDNSSRVVQMSALDHLEVYEKYKKLFNELEAERGL